jgi:hypothetical protein
MVVKLGSQHGAFEIRRSGSVQNFETVSRSSAQLLLMLMLMLMSRSVTAGKSLVEFRGPESFVSLHAPGRLRERLRLQMAVLRGRDAGTAEES